MLRLFRLLVVIFVSASGVHGVRRRLSETGVKVIDIAVHLTSSNAKVDKDFLSTSMPDRLSKWHHIPFHDQKFIELCQEMGHSGLRATANPLIAAHLCSYQNPDCARNTLSLRLWEKFYHFTRTIEWDVSFGFTNFNRKENLEWDDADAIPFLEYMSRSNLPIQDFFIGNEPDIYQSPIMTVQDIQHFRQLLVHFPIYHHSSIIGPEITPQPTNSYTFLKDFLKYGGCKVVDQISIHQYHAEMPNVVPTYRDMLNTSLMDLLESQLEWARKYLRIYNCTKPLRLTQATDIFEGFGEVSNRFISGLLWLDTLGVCARSQVTRVYRHSIWGKSGSLFNEHFNPNPDYYLSVLFKRLVQGPVFNVTTNSKHVRAYANCARPLLYPKGTVVIYLLNVMDEPVRLYLEQFQSFDVHTYFFTAGDTGVLARTVRVSDLLMAHTKGRNLTFIPRLAHGSSIPMPARSYGFIVVLASNQTLCREMRQSPHENTIPSTYPLQNLGVARSVSKLDGSPASASNRRMVEAATLAFSVIALLSLDLVTQLNLLENMYFFFLIIMVEF